MPNKPKQYDIILLLVLFIGFGDFNFIIFSYFFNKKKNNFFILSSVIFFYILISEKTRFFIWLMRINSTLYQAKNPYRK